MSEKIAPIDRASSGPFDSSEVSLAPGFIDFGALRMTPTPGVGIKIEVEEATSKVVALTIEVADSTLQVSVFSASKAEGLWLDVLNQLETSITSDGGTVTSYGGQLGRGIDTSVVQQDGSKRRIRFIGVDGPRWFLRGSVTGAALEDIFANELVENVFRSIVVHRGVQAMPPREPLELLVPAGVIAPPKPVA
mgnify:CR=1 FL=1